MATRKDLLKAEAFTSRRMIAAFVDRDPDDPTPPLRRVGVATFVSVLLGVVLLAGTSLLGWLGGGATGKSWQSEDGVILADTQAGVLFVWTNEKLVPVSDVASARLLAGGENASGQPRVIKVKTEALEGVAQETTRGIPGAPRQLPPANRLEGFPIRLCSTKPRSGERSLTLEFEAEQTSDMDTAFVAKASNGREYLIANGRSFELWRGQAQTSPLRNDLPLVVPGDSWIHALPAGPTIRPREVPDRGSDPANNVLQLQVGQFAVIRGSEGSADRYYLQLSRGLVQVAYMDMLAINTYYGSDHQPREIRDADLARARHPETTVLSDSELPMGVPKPPEGFPSLDNASVCATYYEDGRIGFSVGQDTPALPSGSGRPDGRYIDYIDLGPLEGALVSNNQTYSPDAPVTWLVLSGRSYPIPNDASRQALGYKDAQPSPLPGGLISLIAPGLIVPGDSLRFSSVQELPS